MSKFRYFKMQELNPEEESPIEQFHDRSRLMYDMFRLCHNTYVRLDEDLIKALYVPLDYNDGNIMSVNGCHMKVNYLSNWRNVNNGIKLQIF